MFQFSFQISNPFVKDVFRMIKGTAVQLTENKSLELGLYRHSRCLISFTFQVTAKTDHAGVELETGLFGYFVMVQFYDNRHCESE